MTFWHYKMFQVHLEPALPQPRTHPFLQGPLVSLVGDSIRDQDRPADIVTTAGSHGFCLPHSFLRLLVFQRMAAHQFIWCPIDGCLGCFQSVPISRNAANIHIHALCAFAGGVGDERCDGLFIGTCV